MWGLLHSRWYKINTDTTGCSSIWNTSKISIDKPKSKKEIFFKDEASDLYRIWPIQI
jgi:hypothetical protein